MDSDAQEMEEISSENEEHLIKEAHKDKEFNSIKLEDFEKINTSICKLEGNGIQGMGFFCEIPDPEIKDKNIKVLLTCYHVVKIKEVDKIRYYNHSNKWKEIYLNEKGIKRRYWYNEGEDMDYTCIELLEKDEITDYYFLGIDKNIKCNNYTEENLKDKRIYIFKKGEESSGKIILIDKTKIKYTNETESG